MTNDERTNGGSAVDPSRETVSLMYDEVRGLLPLMSSWSDAIDAKVVAVFTVGSLLIGVIPALDGIDYEHWKWIPWSAAGLFWLVSGWFAGGVFWTRSFGFSPDPREVTKDDWMGLSPDEYRMFRIRDMANDFSRNQEIIDVKADALTRLIVAVAAESGFLLVALFVHAA